ncbi:MAG: DUF1648 domain-containing protein [Oscillospiraceae bacterium]|nr:DUF1648 domain-containing protein [Oscillospiraceae bacterium]
MNTKPRLIDYILLGLSVLCFLFTLIYGCIKLPQLPDLLPSHFNFAGEIDGWSGKAGAVSAPIVFGFLMLVILGPIQFFPQVWNNTQGVPAYKLPRLIRATRTMMSLMLLSSEAFMAYTLLCSVHLTPMHPAATPIYFVLIGVPIVVVLFETFRK